MYKTSRDLVLETLKSKGDPPRSPLAVCFSSSKATGSWQIRGEQIAAMRSNWRAEPHPIVEDLDQFDLFCFIKRPDFRFLELVRSSGKPIVLDIVDGWKQPRDGFFYRDIPSARRLFKRLWARIDADGYIFPTQTMCTDLGDLVSTSTTIYHHYYPLLKHNPVRAQVETVGFVGKGLGGWRAKLSRACEQRGIRFVVNPKEHTELDVVVIVRGGTRGSFLARRYKSNVKLANAYGSGTPALVHVDEMSAHDTDNGEVLFFTDEPGSFAQQLDRLINDHALRKRISEKFLDSARHYDIKNIAGKFEDFFVRVAELKRAG